MACPSGRGCNQGPSGNLQKRAERLGFPGPSLDEEPLRGEAGKAIVPGGRADALMGISRRELRRRDGAELTDSFEGRTLRRIEVAEQPSTADLLVSVEVAHPENVIAGP